MTKVINLEEHRNKKTDEIPYGSSFEESIEEYSSNVLNAMKKWILTKEHKSIISIDILSITSILLSSDSGFSDFIYDDKDDKHRIILVDGLDMLKLYIKKHLEDHE